MSDSPAGKNYRITLYIDTPKPLLRPFKDFTKHNQIESLITTGSFNPVAVTGHAFVGLTDENGDEKRWGYTCERPSLFKSLRGMKGMMVPEEPDSPYNEAIVWQITKDQFDAARTAVDKLEQNPGTYKLFSNNCASVATSVLQAAGVPDLPSGKTGLTPYGLTLKKRLMLAGRRAEVMKFKIKNALAPLFGKKKAPKSELLDSLRAKPVPVPIKHAMKHFKENRDNNETKPVDLNRVISSLSRIRP